jgi:hypothetical protein
VKDDALPIPETVRALRSADMRETLVVCAAWFDRQAKICPNCKGVGRVPEVWEVRQIIGRAVRVQAVVAAVGYLWHDCRACRQFRHLAARCRGINL